jgi:PAS domain S-box-containing protein
MIKYQLNKTTGYSFLPDNRQAMKDKDKTKEELIEEEALLQSEEAVLYIVKGISATIGKEFFNSLVEHLSAMLKADYAYIAELLPDNPNHAKTLSLIAGNQMIDNVEVDLAGTPCEKVLEKGSCAYPSGIPEKFPNARMMVKMGVQSYIGTTLFSSSGKGIGLISAMFKHPVKNTSMIESLLQIFAARASAELERRQTEIALKNSEKRYRALLETAPLAIYECDTNGLITLVNPSCSKLTGYSEEELLQMYVWELQKPGPQRDSLPEYLKHLVQEQPSPTPYVCKNLTKDGRLIDVQIDWTYERDKQGQVAGFVCILSDITERRLSEEALQKAHDNLEMRVKERTYELESAVKLLENEIDDHKSTEKNLRENEKRFRAVADSTADLLWEGDVRNSSLNWFGDIDAMLGFAQGEFPRTIEGHMEHIHPEDKKRTIKAIEKSLQTGDDFFAEYRIRRKDGTYSFWDERGKAIGFQDGKAVKWVGAVSDITKRKKIDKELSKAEKELRIRAGELTESNAALKVLLKQREQDQTDFENNILSNIKHLIMPYIEKLKKNKLEQDGLSYLNIIESNLNEIVSPFATKLSFQFLDFTPREIMIADLIKDGKQDKDIMEILHISIDTVKTHRKNIRRKLGIYGKRINLRTKLLSLTS